MSEPSLLSHVAELLRPVSKDVLNGRGKLCLSTVYLKKLDSAFDEKRGDLTSSFHQTDAKATLQRDLQFLLDLVKGTIALKLTPDLIENEESNIVSLRKFKNIKILEIHKIDVKNVLGIQRLRSQLQELSCMYNLEVLGDILAKCGGDLSSPNLWGELKKVNFSHNRISDIDASLESAPWLNTLDLSYNQLTSVEFINTLPNLKNLNLSYNKLEKVPRFRGQICKRLQVLLLNNNFIEDLSGLYTLANLLQLDLSQNCIMDHKALLSISHMPSLYFLNLQGNPINFHPHHRTITCNYLNKNTATLKFVLDNMPLNKSEKFLAGSLYPISQSSLDTSYNSSQNSLDNVNQERLKKVRHVEIQEGYDDEIVVQKNEMPISAPRTSSEYLEVKNKIEKLRQEYGESWLARQSGIEFQEVLGFEKHSVLSCTPSEANPAGMKFGGNSVLSSTPSKANHADINFEGNSTIGDSSINADDTAFVTASTEINQEEKNEQNGTEQGNKTGSIYDISVLDKSNDDDLSSGDDEICDSKLFFATAPDSQDLSIILTETHLSERDSITYKQLARWHINIVKSCQQGDKPNEVQIVFNTFRRDRKSRTYYMEEAEEFIKTMFDLMVKNKVPEKRIQYQCIKCNELFSRAKGNDVLVERTVTCPKCGNSNMVIESN